VHSGNGSGARHTPRIESLSNEPAVLGCSALVAVMKAAEVRFPNWARLVVVLASLDRNGKPGSSSSLDMRSAVA
jgi:hypothetical protein